MALSHLASLPLHIPFLPLYCPLMLSSHPLPSSISNHFELFFLIFESLNSLLSISSVNNVTMPGQIKSLLGTMRRKPAKAPDGKSDEQAAATPTVEKTSVIHDLTHLDFKNAKTVTEAITTIASGEPLDDKEVSNCLPIFLVSHILRLGGYIVTLAFHLRKN